MKNNIVLIGLLIFLTTGICFADPASSVQITEVRSKEYFAGGDEYKKYFLIDSGEEIESTERGFGLVVVLPGETGGADLLDFVKDIYKNHLNQDFIVAQIVAVRWDRKQRPIWPTEINPVQGQLFSTEEFIEDVIEDVLSKYKINPQQIFTLCWDNSGQAGYLASVRENTPITGSLIVMSDFQADWFDDVGKVTGKTYYIIHSTTDDIFPIDRPQMAYKLIANNGGIVNMEIYKGGHGWQGNSLRMLRLAFRWLQKQNDRVIHSESEEVKKDQPKKGEEETLVIKPLTGVGEVLFNMNKYIIISKLGEPERITDNKLFYISNGLELSLSPGDESLMAIACGTTTPADKDMIELCNCKTDKGIGMGSSRADIIKAYGSSDSEIPIEQNVTIMFYDSIKAEFIVTDNKVTYMIFKRP